MAIPYPAHQPSQCQDVGLTLKEGKGSMRIAHPILPDQCHIPRHPPLQHLMVLGWRWRSQRLQCHREGDIPSTQQEPNIIGLFLGSNCWTPRRGWLYLHTSLPKMAMEMRNTHPRSNEPHAEPGSLLGVKINLPKPMPKDDDPSASASCCGTSEV